MRKLELLKEFRDKALYKVRSCSDDQTTRTPRMDCQAAWHEAKAELLMLNELISEREDHFSDQKKPTEMPLRLDLSEAAEAVAQNTFTVKVKAALELQPMIEQARAIQKAFCKLEDELVRMDACHNTAKD